MNNIEIKAEDAGHQSPIHEPVEEPEDDALLQQISVAMRQVTNRSSNSAVNAISNSHDYFVDEFTTKSERLSNNIAQDAESDDSVATLLDEREMPVNMQAIMQSVRNATTPTAIEGFQQNAKTNNGEHNTQSINQNVDATKSRYNNDTLPEDATEEEIERFFQESMPTNAKPEPTNNPVEDEAAANASDDNMSLADDDDGPINIKTLDVQKNVAATACANNNELPEDATEEEIERFFQESMPQNTKPEPINNAVDDVATANASDDNMSVADDDDAPINIRTLVMQQNVAAATASENNNELPENATEEEIERFFQISMPKTKPEKIQKDEKDDEQAAAVNSDDEFEAVADADGPINIKTLVDTSRNVAAKKEIANFYHIAVAKTFAKTEPNYNVVHESAVHSDDDDEYDGALHLKRLMPNKQLEINKETAKRRTDNSNAVVTKRFCVRSVQDMQQNDVIATNVLTAKTTATTASTGLKIRNLQNLSMKSAEKTTATATATVATVSQLRQRALERCNAALRTFQQLQNKNFAPLSEFTYVSTVRKLPMDATVNRTCGYMYRSTLETAHNLSFDFNTYSAQSILTAWGMQAMPCDVAQIAALLQFDIDTIDARLKAMKLPKSLQNTDNQMHSKYLRSRNVHTQTIAIDSEELKSEDFQRKANTASTQTDDELIGNQLSIKTRGLPIIKLLNNFNEFQLKAMFDFCLLLFSKDKADDELKNTYVKRKYLLDLCRSVQRKTKEAAQAKTCLLLAQQQQQPPMMQRNFENNFLANNIARRPQQQQQQQQQQQFSQTATFYQQQQPIAPSLRAATFHQQQQPTAPSLRAATFHQQQQPQMQQSCLPSYSQRQQAIAHSAAAAAFHSQQQQYMQSAAFHQQAQMPRQTAAFHQPGYNMQAFMSPLQQQQQQQHLQQPQQQYQQRQTFVRDPRNLQRLPNNNSQQMGWQRPK